MLRFTKMQGTGNDYIFLNCMERRREDAAALAVRISDRHFGVGGDGLICIGPSDCADFCMDIYNADGSRAELCGNGLRCVGKYVYDHGLTGRTELTVETLAGVRALTLHVSGGGVTQVTADMGIPRIEGWRTVQAEGQAWELFCVSMGNPHGVLFVEDSARAPVETWGPALEHCSAFPMRTNVEFVTVADRERLSMRVWERGSGETLACGTGACAALAACVQTGRCGRTARVQLPGGTLKLCWRQDDHMELTGPAETAFEGEWPEN